MYETVEFLGYVVSKDGVRPNESGVVAIKKFPTPKKRQRCPEFCWIMFLF